MMPYFSYASSLVLKLVSQSQISCTPLSVWKGTDCNGVRNDVTRRVFLENTAFNHRQTGFVPLP